MVTSEPPKKNIKIDILQLTSVPAAIPKFPAIVSLYAPKRVTFREEITFNKETDKGEQRVTSVTFIFVFNVVFSGIVTCKHCGNIHFVK